MNTRVVQLAFGGCLASLLAMTPGTSQTPNCGLVDYYCDSLPNSTGLPADISITGSMSVTQTDTMIEMRQCPVGSYGILVYGQGQVHYPFGDGILCISPYNPGLFRMMPVHLVTSSDPMLHQIDFAATPPGGEILAGDNWNFQLVYRDLPAAQTGFNTSNAFNVTFCP